MREDGRMRPHRGGGARRPERHASTLPNLAGCKRPGQAHALPSHPWRQRRRPAPTSCPASRFEARRQASRHAKAHALLRLPSPPPPHGARDKKCAVHSAARPCLPPRPFLSVLLLLPFLQAVGGRTAAARPRTHERQQSWGAACISWHLHAAHPRVRPASFRRHHPRGTPPKKEKKRGLPPRARGSSSSPRPPLRTRHAAITSHAHTKPVPAPRAPPSAAAAAAASPICTPLTRPRPPHARRTTRLNRAQETTPPTQGGASQRPMSPRAHASTGAPAAIRRFQGAVTFFVFSPSPQAQGVC